MVSLEFAKQHINLVELAVNKFGYRVDRRKSSKHYKTLKRDGDVIIVKRNSKNRHWIYFSAVNEDDNGTIIDFIQNRTGDSLGAVRRFIQEYVKEKREGKIKEITDFELEVSSITEHQNAVLREYTRLRDLSRDNYLNEERGISIELSKYDIWEDDKGNVVFGLYGENGELIGLAKYNRNFKQIIGQKGIWSSYTGNREDVKRLNR
ncbi:MAG: hypothetical protein Q9M89_01610 [Persephonella sp.]|nr:hypothetical protein [Persephonella sp.]